jgi:hypothetical protein
MAQRLANIAPPGSLLKQPGAKPKRKADMGRSPRQKDAGYLEMIRQLPCVSCRMDPCGEAAHIRMARAAAGWGKVGLGEKPDDVRSLPLCPECHRNGNNSLHVVGEQPFFDALGIDPVPICQALQRLAPNVEGMRAAVFAATAIGGKE